MEEKARWDDNSERSIMPEGLVNWQPIETAPKDGSKILVYLACAPSQREWDAWHIYLERYTIGFWLHDKWKSIETKDCGTMGSDETGWMEDIVPIDIEPTHWMPLPEPPTERNKT
jgi:hypothetical protein